MKPSTLASYLESLAGLIRSSRPGDSLPTARASTHPRHILEVIGTRAAGPLPIPAMDQEAHTFLAQCMPGLIRTNVADAAAQVAMANAGELDRVRETARRFALERDEARRELEALRRTVDRMRVAPSVTVAPAPRQAPAPIPAPAVSADLLNMIADETAKAQNPSPAQARPSFTVHPVVLAFPPNGQGKTLAAAAVALDEVRALFTFKFLDPRDATKGGYWLAKDPTAPAVHALVATLTKHGAFTRDTIPGPGHRMGGVNA